MSLYFRQWLSGQDFAVGDPIASQMVNFVYAIGDTETREAVLVDPAYATSDLMDLLAADDMKLTGMLATHWHPDHVGGEFAGHTIEGVAALLDRHDVQAKVHVQAPEAEMLKAWTGIGDGDIQTHSSGDVLTVGNVEITLIHTPGHTPGSQCFCVRDRLVSGDTLFLEGCGRTDLPGGDPDQLYESLTQRLAAIPDDTILYPGHRYAPSDSASMGETRQSNFVYRIPNIEAWRQFMG